ncbi:MGH1-like glycoside hydrolase domain-containing protein [Angustibacter luteus]|uniref:Glucosidase n=1 Tax=Angustibacter luteus TaxID=658456 RepID=A0ABW1JFZ6_9ACTN
MTGVERSRVDSFGHPEDGLFEATPWYHWGPYLSERSWGTVREDYSADGEAWDYFPHDHARSRAYRWGEDGMAGVSDVGQNLCLALALWNGRDPILKERMFGLTGPQGNHGEDAKEYWWFLDALPSHSWLKWRYHYPQAAFPYADLVSENGKRDHSQPEYELLDTGVFDDDRYWVVDVVHAKADPHDLLMEVSVTNAGPDAAALHVLPHLWFRNTWAWDVDAPRPSLRTLGPDRVAVDHPTYGELVWEVDAADTTDGAAPELLFCENDTNTGRLFGSADSPAFPKDGINDHVVSGAATVNPDGTGTKCAAWYQLAVEPGQTRTIRVRLRPPSTEPAFGADFDDVLAQRQADADEFYGEVIASDVGDDERLVARQAFAGMLWGKQFYCFDVKRWLNGDPTQPPPAEQRRGGRNAAWTHLDARDIMSMPDPWEYPWFAAWDLAFHTVALAHVDPAFAKYQLLALCREWFQHPNGALPAYEWAFGDTNPPVHAWAALHVWDIDGRRDRTFLARLLPKLLINFTWWVNRIDPEGDNVFGGGFLGLDNISALDRSHLPAGARLEQADGTAWMAFYALSLLQIANELAAEDDSWTDIEVKFIEHFVLIADAMRSTGLWDEEDGFFYDVLHLADGTQVPIKVRSIVGVLPLLSTVVLGPGLLGPLGTLNKRFRRFVGRFDPEELAKGRGQVLKRADDEVLVLGVVPPGDGLRVLSRVFDEDEFLSPYGLRALSRYHRDHPVFIDLDGGVASVDYEPAESSTGMFGGNSNWRGPVWMPVNYLVVRALQRNARNLGEVSVIEYPTGSGQVVELDVCAQDLRRRLISLFLRGPDGRRPSYGQVDKLQNDPRWRDNITFNEYFHGDNGAGLGATHQTGWTGLVADLICRPDPFAADGPGGVW